MLNSGTTTGNFFASVFLREKTNNFQKVVFGILINVVISAVCGLSLRHQAQEPTRSRLRTHIYELLYAVRILGHLLDFSEPCSGDGLEADCQMKQGRYKHTFTTKQPVASLPQKFPLKWEPQPTIRSGTYQRSLPSYTQL